jgi:hypothetical protein
VSDFVAANHGPFADLLAEKRRMPLGPGTPNPSAKALLERMAEMVDERAVQDRDMLRCCQAGLWLYHDYLDQSHDVSQDIHTPAGSYWHAILHRREPDYWNSKYWFRRVGQLPIFETLHPEAAELARRAGLKPAAFLTSQPKWDPCAFVDLCERAAGNALLTSLCCDIQQREWELLFDYCYRQAI